MRFPLLVATGAAVAVVVLVLAPTAAPAAVAQDAPAEPEVVVEGKGFGHGVGMPQDGAYAMGVAGASASDILATFYPGTAIGSRSGNVQVELFDRARAGVVIGFPAGGQIREGLSGDQSPGLPVTVHPGGSVRVFFDDGYHVTPLDAADVAAGPSPAATPPEPAAERALWAVPEGDSTVALPEMGKRYRGTIETRAAGGGIQLVDHLDVEQYLRGMGEVLAPSWPPAALQAQAIVARTYALQLAAAGRPLCSSQQCQVYLGQTAEYAAMNRAVAATAGQVVTYGGRLAEAVYSASSGGVTATPEEGFGPGSPEYPYLQPVPYPTDDPQPWDERLTLRELAAGAGYRGEASDVRVTRVGPSGRALEITFTGDTDALVVDGHAFASRFGLRSTLFTLRVERPPDPNAVAPAPQLHRPAVVFQAGAGGDAALGRAPWVALAILLLVASAIAINTLRRSRADPHQRRL